MSQRIDTHRMKNRSSLSVMAWGGWSANRCVLVLIMVYVLMRAAGLVHIEQTAGVENVQCFLFHSWYRFSRHAVVVAYGTSQWRAALWNQPYYIGRDRDPIHRPGQAEGHRRCSQVRFRSCAFRQSNRLWHNARGAPCKKIAANQSRLLLRGVADGGI